MALLFLLLSILPTTFSIVIGTGTYVSFSISSWDLSNGLGPSPPENPQTQSNETMILEVIKSLNTDVITLQEVDNGTSQCPIDILSSFKKTIYANVWYQPLRQYANGGTTGNAILSKTPAVTSTSASGATTPIAFFRFVNGQSSPKEAKDCAVPKDSDYCEGAMAAKVQLGTYSTYGVWIVNTILSNNTTVQTDQAKQLYSSFINAKVNPFLPQPTIVTGNFNTLTYDAPALNILNPNLNNSWLWCGTGTVNNYTYPSNYPNYTFQYMYFNGSFLSGSSFSTDQNKIYPTSITCTNGSSYVFWQNNTNYLASFHLPKYLATQLQLPSIWAEFLLFTPEELAMLILVPFFSIIMFFICVWIAYVFACKKKDDAYNEWKHTPIDDLSTKQGGQDMGMNTRGYQQPPQTRGGRSGFQEVEEPPRDAPPRGQYDGGYDEEPSTHEPPRRGPPPRGPPPRDDYDDYDGGRRGVTASGERAPPPPRRDGRNVPPPPPRGGGGGGYQQREYPDDDGRGRTPSRGSDRGNSNNRPRAGQLL
jgi:endonuclease/exonuclease/phosphatase family metal-dependent hydrolase